MMMVVSALVFAGAMTLSLAAMWLTVAPQWQRVLRLASGQADRPFHPLEQLALAERRIAVRRWAATPAYAPVRRLRAA